MRASGSSGEGATGRFHTTRWELAMVSATNLGQSVPLAGCGPLVAAERG
jgi:hypothetical protein